MTQRVDATVKHLQPTAGWELDLLELCVVEMPPTMVAPEGALTPPIHEAVNIMLLRRPGKTLLLDAGPGLLSSWMPGLEVDLDASLAAAECARDDIDRIVLTHLHFDHVGGLVEGTWPDRLSLAFPQADVALLTEAADWARAAPREAEMNAGTTILATIEQAAKLYEIRDGDEVADSVSIRATPGHAPGHATIEVGGEDPLVFLGDVIHHPIHAHRPEWAAASDSDREEALATRTELLAELAARHVRVVAPHLREPSVGRFERAGHAYRWVTSTASNGQQDDSSA